jgi:hypothetical protein
MHFSFTILNILSVGVAITMLINIIYLSITEADGGSWSTVAMISILGLALGILAFDFVIQFITQNASPTPRFIIRNGIAILVLIGLYYFNQNYKRRLIITVPNDYEDAVGIVYNFPDAKPLPRNLLTLHSNIQLPESGIIFTSSEKRKNDIPSTKFFTQDGKQKFLTLLGKWEMRYSRDIDLSCEGTPLTVRIINVGEYEGGDKRIADFELKIREEVGRRCTEK